jgi:hypothetical protein
MRLTFTKQVKLSLLAFMFLLMGVLQAKATFVHPGILFSSDDLLRIKDHVNSGQQPWRSAYAILNGKTDINYVGGTAHSIVYRATGETSPAANAMSSQSQIAYRSAIMWVITGDIAYANIAKTILNSWSFTLTGFTGNAAKLCAAWYGFPLVNAAEILRYTDSGWSQEDIQQAEHMFRNVFYPVIENFQRGYAGNWDTAITKTIMGIGVFLNDEAIFNKGVNFLSSTTDNANGTLRNYIYPTGQCWESGRDQEHTQMGLGGLVEACEVGYKQGLDLYGLFSNRLLLGSEYTAKYNLGYNDVPYTANHYGTVISDVERGEFLPFYEAVYNHYVNRKGVSENEIRYTKRVVDKIRAEKGGENGDAILLGYGTLLFNEYSTFQYQYVPTVGDYRTARTDGSSSSLGTANQFERYDEDGNWVTASVTPGLTTNVIIRDGQSAVATTSNRNLRNLIVGEGYGAILKAEINAGAVSALNITEPGRLSAIPPINFVNGGQAAGSLSATATISEVNVTGADIKNRGSGYTYANITFSGGGGSGAAATAAVSNGRIEGITITNPGSGYTSIPGIVISGDGTGAVVSAKVGVTQVTISNGGSGYTIAPKVITGTFLRVNNGIAVSLSTDVSFQRGSSVYIGGATAAVGTLNIRGKLSSEEDINFVNVSHANTNSSLSINFRESSTISGKSFTFGKLSIETGTLAINDGTIVNVADAINLNGTSVIDATKGTFGFVDISPSTSLSRTIANNTFVNGAVNNLMLNSTEGIILQQDLMIDNLDIQKGLLNLPVSTYLQVSGIAGGGNNAYINTISEPSGAIAKVIVSNISSYINVPLGNGGNYLPVTITPQSASDFKLGVLTGLTDNGLPNGNTIVDKSKFVDAAYHLTRTNGTGNFIVKLGFPESLKGNDFSNPSGVYFGIAGYADASWGAATGSGSNAENYATATFDTNNAGVYRIEIDETLPLNFVNIAVKAKDNFRRAEVSWTTLNEVGVQGFEIQRSADGKDFHAIGTIKSDGSQSYKYVDENLLSGISYYRIKSIEANGNDSGFSKVASLLVKFNQYSVNVYPNPVTGQELYIDLGDEFLKGTGEVDFVLTDISGRRINIDNISGSGHKFQLSIPPVLKSGVYNLKMQKNEVKIIKPILIYR